MFACHAPWLAYLLGINIQGRGCRNVLDRVSAVIEALETARHHERYSRALGKMVTTIGRWEHDLLANIEDALCDGRASHSNLLLHLMNYEMLALDSLVFERLVPMEVLVPASGDTAYEWFWRCAMLHQGYQLGGKHPGSAVEWRYVDYDDAWYVRHTLGQRGVIETLKGWPRGLAESHIRANVPVWEDCDSIHEWLVDQMIARHARKEHFGRHLTAMTLDDRNYARFVGLALDFNERSSVARARVVVAFCSTATHDRFELEALWLTHIDRILQCRWARYDDCARGRGREPIQSTRMLSTFLDAVPTDYCSTWQSTLT